MQVCITQIASGQYSYKINTFEPYDATPHGKSVKLPLKRLPRINKSTQLGLTGPKSQIMPNDSQIYAQRAMIKYNLSSEDGDKYQNFIQMLSTFDQSIG